MSIVILGSNDQKLNLRTENHIDSIINNQEILYSLYKNKYLYKLNNDSDKNTCQNTNLLSDHLLKQLIKTFYKYDYNQDLIYNVNKLNNYLYLLNNNSSILNFINSFLLTHNLLNNLNDSIKKNLIKIFENKYKDKINKISLNNNYIHDIYYTLDLIQEYSDNKKVNDISKQINIEINKLSDLLKTLNIIILKQNKSSFNKLDLKKEDINNCQFINNLINNLDFLLVNLKSIKINILKIESIINIITELFYKLYLEL